MDDLISRQAAIDALGGNEPVGDPSKMDDDDVVKMWERIRIINIINKLPSAQPERASCKQVTGKLDLISRQDAIDAIVKCTNCNTPEVLREYVAEHSLWSLWSGGVLEALEAVEALPSAPLYTEAELQTMQDMEWSQMEKMYELGKEESNWISCKERLPEEDGDYFVTFEEGYAEDYGLDLVGIAPYEVDCEGFGIWQEEFDPHTLGSLGSEWVDIHVIAWQPLPEPYKKEGDKDGR